MSYRIGLKDLKKLKDLEKGAIERAAQAIVSYMKDRGHTEFPTIKTKHYSQRGGIYLYFKPNPESLYGVIVELNYDYPNTLIREQIRDRVKSRVREILSEKST